MTKVVKDCVKKSSEKLTTSDKIDKIVTNRWLGIPIFLVVMWAIYFISVTTVGTWMTDWANDSLVAGIQDGVAGWLEWLGAHEVLVYWILNGSVFCLGSIL